MTDIDIKALRELLKAATAGPWREPWPARHPGVVCAADDLMVCSCDRNTHDAAHIVAAVNALPALLDELDELRRDLWESDSVECGGCGQGGSGESFKDWLEDRLATKKSEEG